MIWCDVVRISCQPSLLLIVSESSGVILLGSGTIRLMLRSRVLVAVRTVAVRMMPSAPGWILMILPNGHCIGGTLSSLRMTMVPSRIPWLPLLHLFRMFSSFRYSRCKRRQKCCLTLWMCCQLERRLDGLSLKSCFRKLINASPMRKWPGVRTRRSFGSDDIGVRGRELRTDSIRMVSLFKFSNVKSSLPATRLICRLKDFTAASHNPPKWGELGGMKRHSICRSAKKDWTFTLWSSDYRRFRNSRNSLLAPTKLVPLSE